MASGNGDFIFADDFDMIMAILEEDENVEEQFLEAVQEVSIKLVPKKGLSVSCLFRSRWFIHVLLCIVERSINEQNSLEFRVAALKQSDRLVLEIKMLILKVIVPFRFRQSPSG